MEIIEDKIKQNKCRLTQLPLARMLSPLHVAASLRKYLPVYSGNSSRVHTSTSCILAMR